MAHPNFSDVPKYAEPLYSWPNFSILGSIITGILWLTSEINKGILRLLSSSKDNTLYLQSEVTKGDLNLRSAIQLFQ